MTFPQYAQLIALASLWGSTFLFLRLAAPEFGAVALIFIRTAIAALVLIPIISYQKHWSTMTTHWRGLLFVGLFNNALPYCLFAYIIVSMSSGFASIINAFTPIFAAIIAFIWLKDRLNSAAMVGLLIAFLAALFLVFDTQSIDHQVEFLPIFIGMFATIGYGLASSFNRKYMNHLPSIVVTTGSQIAAALLLAPLAIVFWPESQPSVTAWSSVIALGILCTALALILFYNLLQQVGVTKTVAVTYLVPIFAIFWGWLFLHEAITIFMLLAMLCIFIGISLLNGVFNRLLKIKSA